MINYKPKRHAYLLPTILAAVLLLSGCWGKTLDSRNAEIVHGKIYSNGANSPFSGRVTNMDLSKIPSLYKGAWLISSSLNQLIGTNNFSVENYITLGELCDVNVNDGVLQGKGLCKTGDNVISEFSFEHGVLQNHFKMHNKTSKYVIAEADFDNGLLDGKMLLSNPDNGELIYKDKWKEGKQDGDAIQYTLDGKYPLYKVSFVDGKKDGVAEAYHPTTHKLIAKINWENDVKNGSQKGWSNDGAVLLVDLNWADGKATGFEKQFDATGTKLIVDKTYKDGVEITPSTPPPLSELTLNQAIARLHPDTSNIESCVDGWTAAHRKEVGADAMITADQLDEWKTWCEQGKTPTSH
jgi:antitoxin component YwqK of YwqJK toxin-antitoxin module